MPGVIGLMHAYSMSIQEARFYYIQKLRKSGYSCSLKESNGTGKPRIAIRQPVLQG